MTAAATVVPGTARVPADWPHAAASAQRDAGGLRWHLQRRGPPSGPRVLLLHGTGASTHSWRHVLEMLGDEADLLAVDLPGHAFSTPLPPRQSDSVGFARALDALLDDVGFAPDLLVGHSAGAAVALRLALDGPRAATPVLAVNGAAVSLGGVAGRLFAPAARLISERALLARIAARQARRRGAVARLLASTGSRFSEQDVRLYQRLLCDEGHLAGVLRMMARWDLPALEAALPALTSPVRLLVARGDRTLPGDYVRRTRRALAHADCVELEEHGHLAQEEDPARICVEIRSMLRGAIGRPGSPCREARHGYDSNGSRREPGREGRP